MYIYIDDYSFIRFFIYTQQNEDELHISLLSDLWKE